MTVLNYFVLVSAFCVLQTLGFWWPATTTETPATTTTTTVLKQIPLTYFRTYTYQPLAGNPFSFPFSFGFGAAQTPLLSSARFDPYASSYPPLDAPMTNMGPVMPPAPPTQQPNSRTTASSSRPSSTTTSTTTPAPTTTTTTTSTTTTTTPAPPPPPPPPTTTTSTTTTTRVPPAVELSPPEYPTYNRRIFTSNAAYGNNYYARPQYPFPDYYNYQQQAALSPPPLQAAAQVQAQQLAMMPKSGTRIQFVPCMCPVSVSLTANSAGMPVQSAGMPVLTLSEGTVQARNVEDDDDVDDGDGDGDDDNEDVDEVDGNDEMDENERDFIVSLAADASKASSVSSLPVVSYPVPSPLANPTATTYQTLPSPSLSNAASSTLSKIIIEALPASSSESVERTEAQVPPQDIIVLTAEADRNESLI